MIETIAAYTRALLQKLSVAGGDVLSLAGTLVGVAIMALVCFRGLRWFRFWCAAAGAVLFGMAADVLCRWAGLGQSVLLIALVCAAVGALLAYRIVRCGVFLLCAACCFFVMQVFVSNVYICLAAAALVGLLGAFMTDIIIICSTAVFGALQLAPTLVGLFSLPDMLRWPLAALLAVAGIAVQMHRRKGRR